MEKESFEYIYQKYYSQLYKIAFLYTNNQIDSLNIVQNTFVQYLKQKEFLNEEDQKRWIIKTCINKSKRHFKSYWYRNINSLYLPTQYKAMIYLYDYEGYQIKDIANILHMNESLVKWKHKQAIERLNCMGRKDFCSMMNKIHPPYQDLNQMSIEIETKIEKNKYHYVMWAIAYILFVMTVLVGIYIF